MKARYWIILFAFLLVLPALACGSEAAPTSTPTISTATSEAAVEEAAVAEVAPTAEVVEDVVEPTEEPAPTEEPTAEPTDTPEPTATPAPAMLGDLVEQDGYSFAALSVIDPAPPGMFYEAVAGNRLIAVEVFVGNVSGETFTSNVLNGRLVDADGFTYQPELAGVDNQMLLVEVNPGERVRGLIPFAIPEEAVPQTVKYEFSGFPEIVLQSGLGSDDGSMAAAEAPPLTSGEMPEHEVASMGDLTELNGYSLVAEAVEDPTTPSILYEASEGTRLVGVQIIVGNVSGEQVTVNPLNAYLIDSDGFLYEADPGSEPEPLELSDIGAGERVRGWVAFTIPEDATPAQIKYTVTGFPLLELYSGLTASGE